ncbi:MULTISPECIES: YidB family protein [unclassified Moraxella]|uniref:YidB family protein n=1 Tax=unclassified Moraxella TaxID=2685852 RepID=UPI003AF458E9
MSLLTNLVTQVAQQAIQSKMGGQSAQAQDSMGGLGNVLGGMLGGGMGGQASGVNLSNGFGLDDVIGMAGMAMNGNQAQSQGGMLGQVLGSVLGGGNSMGMNQGMQQQQSGFGGKGMLMAALLPLALSFIQKNGGLSGALGKISGMGFGQQANSWMSAGEPNQSLDANAVSQLFDSNELQQVAQQAGCGTGDVCQGMAELLPQVFDQLTPNGDTGTESQANDEISQILSQLSNLR